MSKISLKHSGGNVVSLNAPTSTPDQADVAFKLPNSDGSAGQFLKTDGSGNLSFGAVSTSATSSRTTSSFTTLSNQAYVDYTGFGTLKRFEIVFRSISTNGSHNFGVQLGASWSVVTTGYKVTSGFLRSSDNVSQDETVGFQSHGLGSSGYFTSGIFRCYKVGGSQDRWYGEFSARENGTSSHWFFNFGFINVGGTLDIIRFYSEGGTFDGGELALVTYAD